MGFIELFLIAIGLSMDAFAASVCKGLGMKKVNYKHGFIIALFFGSFQAFMPLIGWFLGIRFEKYITSIDHWIAFLLLGMIGLHMIKEAISDKGESSDSDCSCAGNNSDAEKNSRLNFKELLLLSVATSIDALAVGITFAFLKMNIIPAVLTIGFSTFVISFFGVAVGNKFGSRYEKRATIAGGCILILIGIKILVEHLMG